MDDSRIVCKICHRQVSKYTCPKCNAPYCSLSCFRSEAHMDCSEAFYKREIEADIRTTPRSQGERRDMMQLLQRFEEAAGQEIIENEAIIDGSVDGDDLEARLAGLDLENDHPDAVWNALNEEEQKRFGAILRDADGVSAQELLELETEVSPWWDVMIDDNVHAIPSTLDIDNALVQKAQVATGPLLLYNILALCIAYGYCVRTYALVSLSTPSDDAAVLHLLYNLVPFLVERRSPVVLASVEDAVSYIWSRVSPNVSGLRVVQPLKDAEYMLMPVPVSTSDIPPRHLILRVLSDVDAFVRRADPKSLKHVPPKLAFYGAHILAQPLQVFSLLRAEITAQVVIISESSHR